MENEEKITGKQLLIEYETALSHTGEYIFNLGKSVCKKVKSAIASDDKKKNSDALEGGNNT